MVLPEYEFTDVAREGADLRTFYGLPLTDPLPKVEAYALTRVYAFGTPSPPLNFLYDKLQLDWSRIKLSWDAALDTGGKPIQSYRIEKRKLRNPGVYLTQCALDDAWPPTSYGYMSWCLYANFDSWTNPVGMRDIRREQSYLNVNGNIVYWTRFWVGVYTAREFGSQDTELELDIYNDPNFFVASSTSVYNASDPEYALYGPSEQMALDEILALRNTGKLRFDFRKSMEVLQGKPFLQNTYEKMRQSTQRQVNCSDIYFGDPMRRVNKYSVPSQCYIVVDVCADTPPDWHEAESELYNCDYYKRNPHECRTMDAAVFPQPKNKDGITSLEACCACGGGNKVSTLHECAVEGEYCPIDLATLKSPAIYYGVLNSFTRQDIFNPLIPIDGRIDCTTALLLTERSIQKRRGAGTENYDVGCFVLQYWDNDWHEITSNHHEILAKPLLFEYTDLNLVRNARYSYRVYANNNVIGPKIQYAPSDDGIRLVAGPLSYQPKFRLVKTNYDELHVEWDDPKFNSFPGFMPILAYNIYVDNVLHTVIDDMDTTTFTLWNCVNWGGTMAYPHRTGFGPVSDAGFKCRFQTGVRPVPDHSVMPAVYSPYQHSVIMSEAQSMSPCHVPHHRSHVGSCTVSLRMQHRSLFINS